MFKMRLIYFRL